MRVKVTAEGVEINGGKQEVWYWPSALRRLLESIRSYCTMMQRAVAAGLSGVGAELYNGPAARGFSEQMAAATITLEDLEDKKATH